MASTAVSPAYRFDEGPRTTPALLSRLRRIAGGTRAETETAPAQDPDDTVALPAAPHDFLSHGLKRNRAWAAIAVAALHAVALLAAVTYHYQMPAAADPPAIAVRMVDLATTPPPEERQLAPVLNDVPVPVIAPPAIVLDLPPQTRPTITAVAAPPAPAKAVAAAPVASTGSAPAAPVQRNNLALSLLDGPAPVYPRESRRLKEEGTVVLAVTVGLNGLVRDVAVRHSSGSPRLDGAALRAIRKWRWQPFLMNGNPVEVFGTIEIPFVLSRKA